MNNFDSELKLKINEIFFSIQGESTYAGKPCIFIRLASCDLRCTWCDTEYAFYEGQQMTFREILKKISAYSCNLVEITGGEPLLQKNVFQLMKILCDKKYEIMLETGGHRDIAEVDSRVKIIMDLKCPSSGESSKNLWANVRQLKNKDEIKFVIGDRTDYDWAKQILKKFELDKNHTVIFSPVFDKIENVNLAEWILQDQLPVRFQIQLHKYIWATNKRGV